MSSATTAWTTPTPAPRCSAVVAIVDVTVTTVNDIPDAVGDSATIAQDDMYDSVRIPCSTTTPTIRWSSASRRPA